MLLLRKLLRLLNRRERRRLALLFAVTPLAALGEMGAVGAMLPFLSAVVDPGSIALSPLSAHWLERVGLGDRQSLLLLLGIGAFLILLSSNALIVFSLWLMLRFSWSVHHRLSMTLLGRYLGKPYAYFLSRNSAGLTGNLVGQVEQVTEGFIVPALTVFSRGTVALALIVFLAVTEPVLALAALGLIGGIYGLFYVVLARRKLGEIGRRRVAINHQRMQVVSEALGGIKDVKLLHAEQAFVDAFRPLSSSFSRDHTLAVLIGTLPRYVVEAVAFGGVVFVTLALVSAGDWDGRVLPLLGMFAFAGYRLMPSIQHAFAALVQVRTHQPAFESLYADLADDDTERESERSPAPPTAPPAAVAPEQKLRLWPRRSFEMRGITFRYPGATRAAIEGLNLSLLANTTTGIVGPTGSGKTTFVDLLLGLLRAGQGQLSIDGVCVDASNIEHWQRSIGYVPQHIYLSDSSVAANVAFGVPEPQIDRARVEEACRAACIHAAISQDLPDGYDTLVGERGARLSGGERQRIGIARALYRRPEVLVLDEATSSLDRLTEEQVMESMRRLAGKKTIVMIAHRETTLRECDVIYRMARGQLELVGSYAALLGGKSALDQAG
jgi:ABC-type bacteriocin/lantibiotic exporter with double-glycine peptidase domain